MGWRNRQGQDGGTAELVIGAPLDGTQQAVATIDDLEDGGWASMAAADGAFDAGAFVAWARSVQGRSADAWRAHDASALQAVIDGDVCDRYAQHLLALGTFPQTRLLLGAARTQAWLAGANAGGGHHNAVVVFDNAVDASLVTTWDVSREHARWKERWLFQRPAAVSTHPSGAVAVCGACGAPAKAEPGRRCRYCGADMTAQTGGWVVTRIQTTMWGMGGPDRISQSREKVRERIASRLPPAPRAPGGPLIQPPRAGPPR